MPGGCALERLDATRARGVAGASNAGANNAGASNTDTSNARAGTAPSVLAAGTSATISSAGADAGRSSEARAGQANVGGAASVLNLAGNAGNYWSGGVAAFAGSGALATGGTVATGGARATGGNATNSTSGFGGTSGVPNGGASAAGASAGKAGNGTGGNGAVPPLHVNAEALGGGRFRLVYDFADAGQLLDWEIPPAALTEPLSLIGGELVVNYSDFTSGGGLALARFRWPMQVTKLTVKSRNVAAKTDGFQHTNFYLATVWLGSWAPNTGYGCIFTGNRFFSMPEDLNGGNGDDTFSNNPNESFLHEITLSVAELKWTTRPVDVADLRPPKTMTALATNFYMGSARYLLLGGYESSNRFDDIVIEGVFGQL